MLESEIFIENVDAVARSCPGRVFAKLLFAQRESVAITYERLLDRAGRYASMYRERGVVPDEVVVIVHNDTEQTIYAFVGAILHGAIPSIFAHPSVKISANEYLKTLTLLLEVCRTRFLLTNEALHEQIKGSLAPGAVEVMTGADALDYPIVDCRPDAAPDKIVLLQHSSGTTGLKKGVALSNASVIHQLRNYAATLKLYDEDRIVSWLPLYHDMGLIACLVLPLATGAPLALMSPFEWIANPIMLLRAIHEEKSSLCWLPNFAYNFLASRIDESALTGLDLSSMRAFINCAEPVSADSHRLFYERFRNNGVREEALCTCYAMAENTFAVTQGGILEPVKIETLDAAALRGQKLALPAGPDTTARQVTISSGRLIPNNRVRIVDDKDNDLPERHLGEILIQSDSMLSEYYNRPDLTSQALTDGWYRSGDLGYLAGDDVFVLGRIKDLIIVAGKNIYPQDIEDIVSNVDGVYPGRVVALGVYDEKAGTEEVVILAETVEERSRHLAIKLAVAKAVREQLECVANDIVLLPHMWLVKSSSGKISRPGNREKYLKELRATKEE
jgi:fatty-acyl-CoA synthase